MKAPQNRPSAIALGSASGRTIPASLPPSSSVSRFSVSAADAITRRPVAVDPVKVILATSGWDVSAAPRSLSSAMTLTTPAGSTSFISSTRRIVVSGVFGEGLMTTVLPVRMAGMICQQAIMTGQFHGVMAATTPIGLRCSSTRPSGPSWTTSIGRSREAVWRVQATAPPISKRDPSPLSGLPCSSVRSWASSSAFASIVSATRAQSEARSEEEVAAHAGKADFAADTAVLRSSMVASGDMPTTAPEEGFLTSLWRAVATALPPMTSVNSCMIHPPMHCDGRRLANARR